MIILKNITKEYGTKTVLDNINLTVYDGEKIAIIGNNGEGKSTLVGVITKSIMQDEGQIVFDDSFGFLKQSSEMNIDEYLEKLSNKEFAQNFEVELKKMGFNSDFNISKENFNKYSPGEKTKIGLAFVAAQNPKVLILDEPTNHLDIKAKELITNYLNSFSGTVLVVSHDKDFINSFAQKIVELKNGKITEYYGNYNDYIFQKEQNQLSIKRNYEKNKKEIADINRQIDVYKRALEKSDKKCHSGAKRRTCNATTQDERAKSLSKFAASRMTKLKQKLNDAVEKPEKEIKIRYALEKGDLKTKYLIIAENLSKKFDNKVLFKDANFSIQTGDKIALIGNNGVGKSTLIDILLEKQSYEGVLRITPSLKIAVMKQDIYDLDENTTINEMSLCYDKSYRTDFITNLCSMNIDKSRFNTKLKFLSSGEKMRIKLCHIILSDANMIILDEPTNHLDILNKDYLEKVLKDYAGTILIVSHDKNFLEHTTTKVLKIENQTIIETSLK